MTLAAHIENGLSRFDVRKVAADEVRGTFYRLNR